MGEVAQFRYAPAAKPCTQCTRATKVTRRLYHCPNGSKGLRARYLPMTADMLKQPSQLQQSRNSKPHLELSSTCACEGRTEVSCAVHVRRGQRVKESSPPTSRIRPDVDGTTVCQTMTMPILVFHLKSDLKGFAPCYKSHARGDAT